MKEILHSYKLSIITINFNNLDGLKHTVESVINQTWKEFEYIIIDGASTDGSAEYIRNMQHHFNYWASEPDKGIYNAMNKGIKVANGDYLLFLNSGDYLINPFALQKSIGVLKSNILIAFYALILANKSVKRVSKDYFNFIRKYSPPHQSTFIHKSLFLINKYNECLEISSDYLWFVKTITKLNREVDLRIYISDHEPIVKMQPGGVSSNYTIRHILETGIIKIKYFDDNIWIKRRLRKYLFELLNK